MTKEYMYRNTQKQMTCPKESVTAGKQARLALGARNGEQKATLACLHSHRSMLGTRYGVRESFAIGTTHLREYDVFLFFPLFPSLMLS
uniref:Uncharacterized protein n=1 Tax=Heterorhabditis bacteriophora TaxID=37862 RepID=A0A1I7X5H4_HETBA